MASSSSTSTSTSTSISTYPTNHNSTTEIDLDEIYPFAIQLARDAGTLLTRALEARRISAYNPSGPEEKLNAVDIVTQTDHDVEAFVHKSISARYPSHLFIGEETYSAGSSKEYLVTDAPTWIVDPLDGTVNFTHGFPMFCVSIALVVNQKPVIGTIYAPMLGQLFSACTGRGAWLNETTRLPFLGQGIGPMPKNAPGRCIFGCEWGKDRRDTPEGNLHRKIETFVNMASEPRGRKYIGCYAQTELGHGSNVRGLETTATWNPDDKTFTIHSPYLTSSKWWIGSLGRTANHAVVMAQLIINGKPYGPHPFVVQIRDMKTHQPLENVYVGDIGPKFGYNTMDNGFLLFNKVKVPHISMLAKFSGVDPKTNQYVKPASASLVYGTLTWVRSTIVMQAGGVLARGVTIATRYCAVRRQFQDRDAPEWEQGENQVLNYTTVQIRLLPLLATTFALHFTGKGMMALYAANQKKMSQDVGKVGGSQRGAGPEETNAGSDLLADLHATSCGLKSLASYTAVEGLEMCRRACGGHGYSSFSGIGPWYADYLPTATWEGDNYMLTQQVARYLLKSARTVLKGNEPTNDTTAILANFLSRQDTGAAFDVLGNDSDIVAAFAWRSAFLTFEALKHRDEQKKSWNSLLVDFYRLSRAHSQYMVVKNFYEALQSTSSDLDPETTGVMHKLFRLYALHTLEQEASEFYTSSAVTVRQIQLARSSAVMKLLEDIRPHAVRLVDAWDFPDWQLDSSLGRYDGKVYEDMFHRASELNPLNKVTVDPYPDSSVLFKQNDAAALKSKL